MDFVIREMTMSDYVNAFTLWRGMPGIALSGADEIQAMEVFLKRNHGLCFVALLGSELIGTVLCGNDGRRGYLYHLAVNPKYRGKKVGSRLVDTVLEALKKLDIQKCHLFVVADNQDGINFWKKIGWKYRDDIAVLSKDI